MCGIWACIGDFQDISISSAVENRGPDDYRQMKWPHAAFVFYRLAIRDLSPDGQQPFVRQIDDIEYVLVCNGEIYNYDLLTRTFPLLQLNSKSDCEIILALYLYLGKNMKAVLSYIQGEFAFVLVEIRNRVMVNGYAARDPYGVRPLFMGWNSSRIVFSSVLRGLTGGIVSPATVVQTTPGVVIYFQQDGKNNYKEK
jgi:asparagine synthase (glutamine-hydrolysing)